MGDNVVDLNERRIKKAEKELADKESELKEFGMSDKEISAMAFIPEITRKDFIGFVKVVGYIRGLSGNGTGSIDFDLENLTVICNDFVPEEYDEETFVETSIVLTETFRVPFVWDSLKIKQKGRTGIGDVADTVSLAVDALSETEIV